MDTNFEYWMQSNHVHTILVIWVSFILEKFWIISNTANPMIFYRILCARLAEKVASDSPNQAVLSGALGSVILIAPVSIIFYLVHIFAGYQMLLDILLLWVLLQFSSDLKNVEQSLHALKNDKPKLAKDLLKKTVIRDTKLLSSVGMIKAAIECSFLRYHHQQIAVFFWYLLAGPTAALIYRLIYETQQAWNIKRYQYRHFGKTTFIIAKIMQLPSLFLFNHTIIMLANPTRFIQIVLTREYWRHLLSIFKFTENYSYLFILCQSIKSNTGGPCIYNDTKLPRQKFVYSQTNLEPSLSRVFTLMKLINKFTLIMLVIITLIVAWQI